MRTLDKELVALQLDSLLDALAVDGPFLVRSDGKEVAVVLPPEVYETMTGVPSTPLEHSKLGFPLSRE